MYYEELALEVNANIAGLEVIKPPVLRGRSGNDHRFSFLAADAGKKVGFDICPTVGEVEILRAFVKRMDTEAETYVVCLRGRPTQDGKELSAKYGIRVLSPRDVGDFFSKRISEHMRVPSQIKQAR